MPSHDSPLLITLLQEALQKVVHEVHLRQSSSFNLNRLNSDQLIAAPRSPSTVNRDPLQTSLSGTFTDGVPLLRHPIRDSPMLMTLPKALQEVGLCITRNINSQCCLTIFTSEPPYSCTTSEQLLVYGQQLYRNEQRFQGGLKMPSHDSLLLMTLLQEALQKVVHEVHLRQSSSLNLNLSKSDNYYLRPVRPRQ